MIYEWLWNSSNDPWNNINQNKWTPYDLSDSITIESAFIAGKSSCKIKDYLIDLKSFT